jgi:prephenate dehydrogenase
MKRIAIVGLGLIGGSLGLAARERLGLRVVGIDRARIIDAERARDCADELVPSEDRARCEAALADAELAVLATPVSVIAGRVGEVLGQCGTVTDCGSTKRQIVLAAEQSPRARRFVPGHPMAGAAEGGLAHACADLFVGRRWLLCPDGRDRDAVVRVEEFVRGLGAEPLSMSAEQHDWVVALLSHVPQLLASAMAVLGAARGGRTVAGPAYEGITRTAGGDPQMWQDIFATNADQVARALRELEAELGSVASALETTPADVGPASRLLERAREGRLRR